MAGLDDITLGNYTKIYYEDRDNADAETEVTEVQSISQPSDESNIVDVAQYGQKYQRKLVGSSSVGAAEIVVNFNPANLTHQYLLGEYKSSRKNTFRIEVNSDAAGSKASSYTFDGYVSSKNASGDFDGVTTLTFSIAVDGALSDWIDAV